jgi:hypothetical protein
LSQGLTISNTEPLGVEAVAFFIWQMALALGLGPSQP